MSIERRSLKEKEAKTHYDAFNSMLSKSGVSLKPKGRVEEVIFDGMTIILQDGKALFAKSGDAYFPLLQNENSIDKLPKIVVDMGAVPHVCNGADIMRPGIRRIEGNFAQGDLVAIAEEKFSKKIAVGKALFTSEEMQRMNHGKTVKNLHYVGDKFWELIKTL